MKELTTSLQASLPIILLLTGLLIAALLGLTIWPMIISRMKTRYLEKPNRQLKQKTNSLIASELHYQQLIDGVKDYAIYWLDLDGNVASWNSGAERIKGYAAKEIIGQHFSRFYTEDDQQAGMPEKALDIARTKGKFEGDGWHVRKDGSLFWAHVTIPAIYDMGGQITGFAKVTSDITERKEFEEELEETNQLNRAILSSAAYLIVATDITGRVIVFNKQAEIALGYSTVEIEHKQTPAIWHDGAEIVKRATELSQEYGVTIEPGFDVFTYKPDIDGIESSEWTFIRKDGSRFPGNLTATTLKNKNGEITGYLGIVEDITQRKQAEHQIMEEATRLQAVMNTVLDGLITVDHQGIIQSFNPASASIFGYQQEEAIGQNINILMPEPHHSKHDGYLEHYWSTGEKKVIGMAREVTGKRKDGMIFPIEICINEMKLDDTRMFVGTIRDITERKKIEQDLRTSEETFRSAIENASIGMALVEPNGRWLKVNSALCELLGYDKFEMLSNDFQSITHPDDLRQDMEYVRKVLADEIKSYQMEKRYYHKSGRIVWTLLSVSLVRLENGKPNYFISQIQDITERKEMERIKSEFISIVSHELRTPLTSIRGSLGLMVGTMLKELPEKAATLLNIAYQNSERLILLINDILDIDKIASGQMRFDIKEEALAPIIEQAVVTNQPYADKFNVLIKKDPIDPELKINIDSARLLQVLANLLSNAAKFSNPDDTVDVSVEHTGKNIRVQIRDHGAGISEEFRARIFGKFSQADSSVTRTKGGTGLGLHISKQMIEQMHGEIGFDTEVGKGTTFWIEFAIAENLALPDDNSVLHYKEDVSGANAILHIEDDPDLSNVLATALHGKYQIITATTLKKAETLLNARHFNMIILDIGMPDGSGLTLLDKLDPSTKVIILSAQEQTKDVQDKVAATMVKSRISETKIIETILQLLGDQS